jgi:hypothetical protein
MATGPNRGLVRSRRLAGGRAPGELGGRQRAIPTPTNGIVVAVMASPSSGEPRSRFYNPTLACIIPPSTVYVAAVP